MCVYVCVNMYVCMSVYVYICVCIYIHIFVCEKGYGGMVSGVIVFMVCVG